jgi:hypothetical protein
MTIGNASNEVGLGATALHKQAAQHHPVWSAFIFRTLHDHPA